MEIEPVARQNLITLAKAYVSHIGTTLGVVSRQSSGDPPYFDRLISKKGTVSTKKYDQIVKWFDAHWPDDLKRPMLITMPSTNLFPHAERPLNGTSKRQQKQDVEGGPGQIEPVQSRRTRRKREG